MKYFLHRAAVTAVIFSFFSAGAFMVSNPRINNSIFAQADASSAIKTVDDDVSIGSVAPASGDKVSSAPAAQDEPVVETFSLWQWFRKGGFFMWPILIAAAVGMGLIIERYLFYRKAKVNPREFIVELDSLISRGGVDEIEKLCETKDMVLSRIILKGLRIRSLGTDHVEKAVSAAGAIETASLEKGLNAISAVGNIAPLLGFLGTVSGMITAFQTIAAADQISARLVAGGIFEALITTQAGLVVAIPMFAFYNYFVHRVDSFVAEVERLASDIVEMILKGHGKN
jgi:biopolymer transport protein ExbB